MHIPVPAAPALRTDPPPQPSQPPSRGEARRFDDLVAGRQETGGDARPDRARPARDHVPPATRDDAPAVAAAEHGPGAVPPDRTDADGTTQATPDQAGIPADPSVFPIADPQTALPEDMGVGGMPLAAATGLPAGDGTIQPIFPGQAAVPGRPPAPVPVPAADGAVQAWTATPLKGAEPAAAGPVARPLTIAVPSGTGSVAGSGTGSSGPAHRTTAPARTPAASTAVHPPAGPDGILTVPGTGAGGGAVAGDGAAQAASSADPPAVSGVTARTRTTLAPGTTGPAPGARIGPVPSPGEGPSLAAGAPPPALTGEIAAVPPNAAPTGNDPALTAPGASAVQAAHTAARAMPVHAPAAQVFARIEQSTRDGQRSFTLRLDPEDLGRVEVRLDFQDGRVQALVAADRPATLEMLQRDARWLERAMEQGGFKLDQDGLQFALRDGRGRQDGRPDPGAARNAARLFSGLEPTEDILAAAPIRRLDGVVDIQV